MFLVYKAVKQSYSHDSTVIKIACIYALAHARMSEHLDRFMFLLDREPTTQVKNIRRYQDKDVVDFILHKRILGLDTQFKVSGT